MNRKHVLAISVLLLLSMSVFPVNNVVALTNSPKSVNNVATTDLTPLLGNPMTSVKNIANTPNTFSPDVKTGRTGGYRVDDLLQTWMKTNELPTGIRTINGEASVMLLVKGDDPTVGGLVNVQTYFVFGNLGIMWVHATVPNTKVLRLLDANPNVFKIESDVKVAGDVSLTAAPSIDALKTADFTPIQPTNYYTREIIGANQIETTFGFDGSGIVVDVQDTGVDFGHTALIGTMAKDSQGRPASLEATGIGVSLTTKYMVKYWTELNATKYADTISRLGTGVFHKNSSGYLDFSKLWENETLIFATNAAGLYSLADLGMVLPDAYYVGDLPGDTTGYTFGISMVLNAGKWTFVPFLLADTTNDGNYDALYLDFVTGYYMSQLYYSQLSPERFLKIAPFDFSTSVKHDNNNPYLSADLFNSTRDMSPDGYMDISIGGLSNTYDAFNFTGRLNKSDPLIRGIDTTGIGFAHVWDYYGHGTAVAGNIAGQDVQYVMNNGTTYSIRGMAPGAKLIATPGLSHTAIVYGWLWSLGYEPSSGQLNPWVFTGEHIADISSNSWGGSDFAQEFDLTQGYDLLSLFVDLLTPKGLVSPSHPGGIFVVAAGNGGPGVGTVSSPATSLSAISVAASTNFWYFENSSQDDPIRNWGPNQGYDEIISWSNRGPTSFGYPKVDVANVGAYDYSILPTNWMTGGTLAYGVFGGTSEATPMTSGALAVILQAYKDVTGSSADINIAKTLLKSTAVDLGYDPYMQGAGRVDIARAVYYLKNGQMPDGKELFRVNTSQSIARGAQILDYAFFIWFGAGFSQDISPSFGDVPFGLYNHPGLLTNLDDTAIYGGYLSPGDSIDTNITVNGAVNSYSALTFKTTYSQKASTIYHTQSYYTNYSLFTVFDKTAIQSADTIQLTLGYDQDDYMNMLSNGASSGLVMYVVNWVDRNNDGKFDTLERQALNLVYADYNAVTLFISTKNLGDNTFIVVRDPGYLDVSKWQGVDFRLSIRAFTRVNDPRISIIDQGSGLYTVTINVETTAVPGQYEGYVKFMGANGGYVLVPYGYSVTLITNDYHTYGWSEITGLTNRINDNGVFPAIDWGWRAESGDYRFYQLELRSSTNLTLANTLAVEVSWVHPGTVLDVYVLSPTIGLLWGTSDINYVGNGKYLSSPNAPPTTQRLLINMSAYSAPNPNYGNYSKLDFYPVITIAIHATAFDPIAIPLEPITIKAAWVSETVDDFTVPQATVSTDIAKTLNGHPITSNNVNVTWSEVDTNPIPSFVNSIYETSLGISSAKVLNEHKTIPAEDLVPYAGGITPEVTHELYLEAGMKAEATLSWDNTGTDFDLLLIPKGSPISYSTDVFGGQASTSKNPEHASATITKTGFYILVIEYFSGDGTNQTYSLEFVASKLLDTITAPGPDTLRYSFLDAGVMDGTYVVSSKTAGWNFDYEFSELVYFDSGAPVLLSPQLVLPEYQYNLTDDDGNSLNWTMGKFYDATPFNITVTLHGKTIYTGMNVTVFTDPINIPLDEIHGFMTNNYVKVHAVDYLGNTLDTSYIIVRTDDSKPVLISEPKDMTVDQNSNIELSWEIQDATNGTWSLSIDGSEVKSGTWLPDKPYSPTTVTVTISFPDVGDHEVTFTVTDAAERVRTSIFTVTVNEVKTGGGFLPISFMSFLVALGILALIPVYRRRD